MKCVGMEPRLAGEQAGGIEGRSQRKTEQKRARSGFAARLISLLKQMRQADVQASCSRFPRRRHFKAPDSHTETRTERTRILALRDTRRLIGPAGHSIAGLSHHRADFDDHQEARSCRRSRLPVRAQRSRLASRCDTFLEHRNASIERDRPPRMVWSRSPCPARDARCSGPRSQRSR